MESCPGFSWVQRHLLPWNFRGSKISTSFSAEPSAPLVRRMTGQLRYQRRSNTPSCVLPIDARVSGARRVVTNERLTRAMHYFDVRMLIHDVNLVESDEPANLQNGFTRHFFVDQSSNNESDAPPPSCDNHYGASSSTATKRKATDDPSSSASMPQSGRARKSS